MSGAYATTSNLLHFVSMDIPPAAPLPAFNYLNPLVTHPTISIYLLYFTFSLSLSASFE